MGRNLCLDVLFHVFFIESIPYFERSNEELVWEGFGRFLQNKDNLMLKSFLGNVFFALKFFRKTTSREHHSSGFSS